MNELETYVNSGIAKLKEHTPGSKDYGKALADVLKINELIKLHNAKKY